jgi:hypothetical protein
MIIEYTKTNFHSIKIEQAFPNDAGNLDSWREDEYLGEGVYDRSCLASVWNLITTEPVDVFGVENLLLDRQVRRDGGLRWAVTLSLQGLTWADSRSNFWVGPTWPNPVRLGTTRRNSALHIPAGTNIGFISAVLDSPPYLQFKEMTNEGEPDVPHSPSEHGG